MRRPRCKWCGAPHEWWDPCIKVPRVANRKKGIPRLAETSVRKGVKNDSAEKLDVRARGKRGRLNLV